MPKDPELPSVKSGLKRREMEVRVFSGKNVLWHFRNLLRGSDSWVSPAQPQVTVTAFVADGLVCGGS